MHEIAVIVFTTNSLLIHNRYSLNKIIKNSFLAVSRLSRGVSLTN